MTDGDVHLLPILARFASIVASILIGGFMIVQAQVNAVRRREWLIQSAREAKAMRLLRHSIAFVCNAIFVWILQVSVVILCATMVGYGASQIFDKPGFLVFSVAVGFPLVVATSFGKRVDSLKSWLVRR